MSSLPVYRMTTNIKQTHIAHVLYSFATGGLENGVVNIINRLPKGKYRHSIICVSDYDEQFYQRITVEDVAIYKLNKKPGKGAKWLLDCWHLLKALKPDVVHTRNLSAIEAQLPAFFSHARLRIHGEHGWDTNDIGGINKKYQWVRRFFKPLIHQYIGLSLEACSYLKDTIGVNSARINHICNGVDVEKFTPGGDATVLPSQFNEADNIIFGTVGRFAEVKNQLFLVDGFIALCNKFPEEKHKFRLALVGDGSLRVALENKVAKAGLEEQVWFTGLRSDIPQLLNNFDVFVLPSLAEGISNTILESMASGVPVIATHVGGNKELLPPEMAESHLVEVNNIEQLTNAMAQYINNNEKLTHNKAIARAHCVEKFSIEHMVNQYHLVYQRKKEGSS